MKNALFSRLKNKFDGLNARERFLVLIGLFILMFFLFDMIVFSPFTKANAALTVQTQEKIQLLSGMRNYVLHKEFQKDLFRGKASDFLALFMQTSKKSQLDLVRLKKTDNNDKEILVRFEGEGDIRRILDFVLNLEKLDFVVQFQKLEFGVMKGSEYHFEGEIRVVKG